MDSKLERILRGVEKPARYTGGEFGEQKKAEADVEIRFALCFPDVYEIGMSNLGTRILYEAINGMDGVCCERVYEPWSDMSQALRRESVALYGLESGRPVSEFDIIGFSVGYEMAYPGILNMLDLMHIPLYSKCRNALTPIVVAGGTCMYNPEPIANFIDIAIIGEGEEVDIELIELYRTAKRESWSKEAFLIAAAAIEGLYVPSLYEISYASNGEISAITAKSGAPNTVTKRIISDLDSACFPLRPIVPSTEIVHDRTVLELFRGCIRGCRFCQAGYVYRPVRTKKCETLLNQAISSLEYSGYQEINLSSLSTSDYKELHPLCETLLDWCKPRDIGLSLPSLRADNFSMKLLDQVSRVRKSGLTFAPEAGSQRMRDVINKNVTHEDIISSCKTAFQGGYSSIKLYFMIGLPGESEEDILAISALAHSVLDSWKECAVNKKRAVNIGLSVSCFVPKPFTPFQWEPQNTIEDFTQKQQLIKSSIRSKHIKYNWHSPQVSFIEAVLARGDRRLAPVIESVFRKCGGLCAWNEHFSADAWYSSFSECDISPAFYANRERSYDEILPWSVISTGVHKAHLISERERSKLGHTTPDCRVQCSSCGADSLNGGFCDV